MYTFEFLKEHELSNVIDIISQRIQWMDEKGMKQWNQGDYLSFYSSDYFLKHLQKQEILGMKEDGQIIGIVGFFHDDERWHRGTIGAPVGG